MKMPCEGREGFFMDKNFDRSKINLRKAHDEPMKIIRPILFVVVFYILGILLANVWGLIGVIADPSVYLPDDFFAFLLFEVFAALLWPVQVFGDFMAGSLTHKICDIAIIFGFIAISYYATRAILKKYAAPSSALN
jgi:hypothetical protein